MVNNLPRIEREKRLKEIIKHLKKIKKYDHTKMVMKITVLYSVQQRKAAEYLRVAEFMIKNG